MAMATHLKHFNFAIRLRLEASNVARRVDGGSQRPLWLALLTSYCILIFMFELAFDELVYTCSLKKQ